MMGLTLWCCSSLLFFMNSAAEIKDNFAIELVDVRPIINLLKPFEDDFYANVHHILQTINLSITHRPLDLFLYPECTLILSAILRNINFNNYATYIDIGKNPCKTPAKYKDYLRDISCAAVTAKTYMYIVVNVPEKSNCLSNDTYSVNCAKWGYKIYDTHVIFNEFGDIVGRYRKFNPIGKRFFDRPDQNTDQIISVKSGIKVAIATMHDLLFMHPSDDLLKRVKKFIVSSLWPSELPFLTSLQIQQMFAMQHNVQIFSSSTHYSPIESGGYAAFNGNLGPWIAHLIHEQGYDMGTRRIGKFVVFESSRYENYVDDFARQTNNFNIRAGNLSKYVSKILDTKNTNYSEKLCHNGFCCKYDIGIDIYYETEPKRKGKNYNYHLVAFRGNQRFWGVNRKIEVCGIVACLNSQLNSCGHRFPDYSDVLWLINFNNITITANFSKNDNKIQYPNSLLSSLRPIHPRYTSWTFREFDNDIERQFSLKDSQNRLMTFAIYGQDFSK